MKFYFINWIFSNMLILFMLSSNINLTAQEITYPISYQTGMIIGNGFDFYNSKAYPRYPLSSRATIKTPDYGQQANTTIHFISDYLSLETALDINFNSSFDIGIVNGSLKVNFYNQVNFEKNTLYLLFKSTIFNSWDYLDNPQLSKEAKDLLSTANGVDNFNNSYGNTFVYGILSGGAYYYGLITITTTTQS